MRHKPAKTKRDSTARYALLTRRRFLLAGAASAAVAVLAACGSKATQKPASPAAIPAPAAAGTPIPAPGPALRQFIALSALLTGVSPDKLDPEAAQGFLTALQQPPTGGMPVDQLAAAAGIAADGSGTTAGFANLAAKGVLTPAAAKSTADAIAANWYSGQVAGAGGSGRPPLVITYNDALGWKALDFTMAPALCGGAFGFWSAKPTV